MFKGMRFRFVPEESTRARSAKSSSRSRPATTVNSFKRDRFIAAGAIFGKEPVTHYLVRRGYSYGHAMDYIEQHFGTTKNDVHAVLVLDEWPVECLAESKLVDIEPYLLKPPQDTGESERAAKKRKKEHHEDDPIYSSDDSDTVRKKEKLLHYGTFARFLCIRGKANTDASASPNKSAIDIFRRLEEIYQIDGDVFRSQAYSKAAAALQDCPTAIKTAQQAVKLPNINTKTASKVEEIVNTGRLRKLEELEAQPGTKIKSLFYNIFGVGPTTARKWYEEGAKTLDDVYKRKDITPAQKIGIEHYDDFQQRIPRDEVTQLYEFIKKTLHDIAPLDNVTCLCMGSYRRGAQTTGDIDIILTRDDASAEDLQSVLKKLVAALKHRGFIRASLGGDDSASRWMGAAALPQDKVWRRLDFLLVPGIEFGAALIYFTGNNLFNRSLRLLASKKGYKLSGRGLYKRSNDELVEGRDERKIFDILGVPYRAPTDRNVG